MLSMTPLPADLFADLGKNSMAYLKPLLSGEETVTYSIHAADGTFLWECADRELACAALRQHEILPLSVH